MQHSGDAVDVQTGPDGAPVRFSWHGRPWQVREVTAHWLQSPWWWLGQGDDDHGTRCEPGRQVWRVHADPGPVVVDLALDMAVDVARPRVPGAGWWLERVAPLDARPGVSAAAIGAAADGLAPDRSHLGAGAPLPGASRSRSSSTSHQEAS